MSLPKEPRQKMINLMYLVLTAMLALNVSAEVLNAFEKLASSLDHSNRSVEEMNSITYKKFDAMVKTDPKVLPLKEEADKIRHLSNEMFNYLEDVKQQIYTYSGGVGTVDVKSEFGKDNLDAASYILIEQDGGKQGKDLEQKLKDYRSNILNSVGEQGKIELEANMPLNLDVTNTSSDNIGVNKEFIVSYFYMTPTIAAIALIDKFQNDIRNTEAKAIDFLFKKIGQDVLVYDKIEPFVSATSNYVMQGETYEAQIGLAAFAEKSNPTITVDGNRVPVSGGIGTYRVTANGIGVHKLNIQIRYKKSNGAEEVTSKVIEYSVGAPAGMSISADGLNLFYIGIDNPVTIAAGTGDEKISASISQGSISRSGKGKYIVKVVEPGEAKVTVSVAGEKTTVFPFRVKNIPNPVCMVGDLESGSVPISKFKAQTGLLAVLQNFEFDAYFTVEKFTVYFSGPGYEDVLSTNNSGSTFTQDYYTKLSKAKSGTMINIMDIYVKGPDGKRRKLPAIAYNLR
ncbi:MAG: gliding motility protein GldM [Chitinophagaceae bacterium]